MKPSRWTVKVLLSVVAVGICGMTSCSKEPVPFVSEATVPYTPVDMLELELSLHRGPTLVEFVQEFNCARCDQMAPTMDDLRAGYSKEVKFHRVSYLSARNRYPLSICPTYLLVFDGQIVEQLSGNQPYPILATMLDNLVAAQTQSVNDSDESLVNEKEREDDAEIPLSN